MQTNDFETAVVSDDAIENRSTQAAGDTSRLSPAQLELLRSLESSLFDYERHLALNTASVKQLETEVAALAASVDDSDRADIEQAERNHVAELTIAEKRLQISSALSANRGIEMEIANVKVQIADLTGGN